MFQDRLKKNFYHLFRTCEKLKNEFTHFLFLIFSRNRTAAENKSILEQSLTIFIKKYEQVLVRSYKNLQESLFCKQSDIFLRNETINMGMLNVLRI